MVSEEYIKTAFGENGSSIDEQNQAIEAINATADNLLGVVHGNLLVVPVIGESVNPGSVISVGTQAVDIVMAEEPQQDQSETVSE